MAANPETRDDPVAAGREALARGDWDQAREAFEVALALEETPEALEGLGWAAWWLADEQLTLRARESAFRAYRARGDGGAAARVAAWLAADYREFRGEDAIGQGWLARARRLLSDLPESVDHGWLALFEANFALNVDGDPDRAEETARKTAERTAQDVVQEAPRGGP